MYALVLGAGEVGFHTALQLSSEKHKVVVVDTSAEQLQRVTDRMDVGIILGPGSSPAILRQAEVERADLLVAVTSSDETNLLACHIASLLAPGIIKIARIRDAQYLSFLEEKGLKSLDVDSVINPEREVAGQIIRFLEVPAASSVSDFVDGRAKLMGLKPPATSPLMGLKLSQIRPQASAPFLVAAIEREGDIIIPRGDDFLHVGDLVYVLASAEDKDQVVKHFGLPNEPVRSLVLVGGGSIGRQVAEAAVKMDIKVRLIERDEARSLALADELPEVMVLLGSGTDLALLEEENVGSADVFCAITDHEEDNVLMALLGRKMGAQRTVARVTNLGYMPIMSSLGLDLVISPRFAAAGAILRFLRRGKILTVSTLNDDRTEVLEAEAQATSDLVGKPLAKVKMPPGALLVAVMHEGQVHIPNGQTIVQPGDRIVIFFLREVLKQVEKLLTVSLEFI